MSQEMSPGKPTTRRYSEAEKERAVRMVRQLRKELGHDHGTIGRVAEQSHEQRGDVRELAVLVRVSDTESTPHRLAPRLGEHTDELLTELGCSPDEIAELRARGAAR